MSQKWNMSNFRTTVQMSHHEDEVTARDHPYTQVIRNNHQGLEINCLWIMAKKDPKYTFKEGTS